MYLARERVMKGKELIGSSNFSAVALNPMKNPRSYLSCFWNRIRDPFYSIE
jgi:hypothetical protein